MAAALAASVPVEWLALAAGAYRDGTRVAGADGPLWAGIFLENRRPVLEALGRFEAQLAEFRAALEAEDSAGLVAVVGLGEGASGRVRVGLSAGVGARRSLPV